MDNQELLLSVIIPARNEDGSIRKTVQDISDTLTARSIPFEVIVVNDNSDDNTEFVLQDLQRMDNRLRYVNNAPPNGIGAAIRTGLANFSGDVAAIMMADGSDSAADLVKYYRQISKGYDCVFGSRFIRGGHVHDYPIHKLIINRLANWGIQLIFGTPCNDVTNAFKCYRRQVIEGIQPLTSNHFNLLVEMPLRAITRGFCYTVIPIHWENRKHGISKLHIREMSMKYISTIMKIYWEVWGARLRLSLPSNHK